MLLDLEILQGNSGSVNYLGYSWQAYEKVYNNNELYFTDNYKVMGVATCFVWRGYLFNDRFIANLLLSAECRLGLCSSEEI